MRITSIVAISLLSAFALGAPAPAVAEQCRDKAGKFTKCEAKKAPTKCRDTKTKKFAKCGAPGTEPVP